MSDNRTYTEEQAVIVEKILRHGDDFYKILEIEKTCSDNDIKKAYRKLSLKVHPDKNGHPKAAESFKRVAKAFEVLGDSNKRTIYDQTGVDPDSRGGATSSGFQRGGGGGAGGGHPFFQGGHGGMPQGFQFGNDDLFDILFGQGPGGPGGATFMFGGPGGFTFQSAGGSPFGGAFGGPFGQNPFGQAQAHQRAQQQRQRTRGQAQQPEEVSLWTLLKNYLPVILLLLVPMLSNLFTETPEQFYLFPTQKFSHQRTTPNYNVQYYITPKQQQTLDDNKLKRLDREAEKAYVGLLRDRCQRETDHKDQKINEAYGWIFPDKEKLEEAKNIKLESCERLAELGMRLL